MIVTPTPIGPARVVQALAELPALPPRVRRLYADVETRAPSPTAEGISPYEGAQAAGWAVTWDDTDGAWYVPLRHADKRWNLEGLSWLRDLFARSEQWANHNIKFDAHFARADGISIPRDLICTLTRSKMLNSDRMEHDLKSLSRERGLPMDEAVEIDNYLGSIKLPRNRKCRNYAMVPADILGRYACMDVLANRRLDREFEAAMPPEQADLWKTEVDLTSVLFDMEVEGLCVDTDEAKREELRCLRTMVEAAERIHEILGIEFIDSNACMTDIMINQLALPILGRTDSGAPSFDKETMPLYESHPRVVSDPRAAEVVSLILAYREESKFLSLYVRPFMEKVADGRIHPTYNQLVRTGRMSSRNPNSQQLSKRAKRLIIAPPGYGILCADASQIEFRIIVHYIQDEDAIRAYREDPKTDFHQWVADLCGIARPAAKNVNFAIGYGAGKRKITAMLMSLRSVVEEVAQEIDARIEAGELDGRNRVEALERACAYRATEIYSAYHMKIPSLAATTRNAENICRGRGYIVNAYKRRRYLPAKLARKAFNSVVQGGAMDFIKTKMVENAPRFNARIRELGMSLVANVHDELVFYGPTEVVSDEKVHREIEAALNGIDGPFRVPLTWNIGWSDSCWAEAKT